MKIALALIAAVLAVVGNVPYIRQVVRGSVRPHAYTWFVWTLVTGITFSGQFVKGAGVGAIPTATSEVFTVAIFLLSLRYGWGDIRPIDTVFLFLALTGILAWVLTKDPTVSVIIAVAIDLIAFVPTLRKAWNHPSSEHPILYAMNVARHALTLFSLEAYNIATTLHSIAMLCVNSIMTLILIMRRDSKQA